MEQADNAQPAQQEEVDITEDEAACQPTQQIHGLTPVRQVEDSENEAACQPTQEVHEPAPVRQVQDSEDSAQPIQKGVVTEQADTTQPAQYVHAKQQGNKHEGVVVREVASPSNTRCYVKCRDVDIKLPQAHSQDPLYDG